MMLAIAGYAAMSFLLLATAYAGAGPGLLLKQASGRQSVWGWVLFGPYLMLNGALFGLYRLISREPAYAPVAPNVFFGRRLSARECNGVPWVSVLDLAAEFGEVPPLRGLPGYRSLPVLDATAPTEEQLHSAVDWVRKAAAVGPVYIHCALGHGRSACVVVAYLLTAGEVHSVAEGMRRVRSLRSGSRLNRAQRRSLRVFEPQQ
jgi:hypothetical protein